MKIKEKFSDTNIFSEIQKLKDEEYFTTFPPDFLLKIFLARYGERELFAYYNDISITEIAYIIYYKSLHKWENLYNIFKKDFSPDDIINTKTITKETKIDGYDSAETRTIKRDNSAYNETDYQPKEKETETVDYGKQKETQNYNKNSTDELIKLGDYLRHNFFVDSILEDLISEVSLNIYKWEE